ncbi:hypothetical protein HN51_048133 [Arachis hypogaea]|uniref:BRF2-like C-terminal domain-containing protein n=2 Tax=Arachis hypogaea TaxID=3818 RepID=A0A445AJP7_ARAHY|nr:plant-specific TFIIB-related protein PTF2 isoform X1 [Arachis ipaensis]QHO24620.1 uncharacterized protein DS421_12g373790 [Arachis hypogaea]RYR26671.1 hypothetical protein Ahy_B02g060950 isoform A [Arachis hypogaea]
MSSSRACAECNKTSFFRDDITGQLACSTCGAIQPFDQFDAQIGGITGIQGTFIRLGTTGSGSVYTYKERKHFAANSLIDDLTSRLGLGSKSNEIRSMISDITEGEFGQGNWFSVLIGSCAYVVMRKDDRPLPMAEVASAVGCDVYELGRMILRVVDFLDLRSDFPEFDIVHSLERTLKNSHCFEDVDGSKLDTMKKQGVFLIQCAVKWFLSTGRRPLPLVVAVLVFVAELNQVEVRIEELATEVHAAVSTCRARYKELLETLVKAAQVLPWGKDVTTKNIVKNAPFLIQYMEKKSMARPGEKRKSLDELGLNMEDVIKECLRQNNAYTESRTGGTSSQNDSQYFSTQSDVERPGIEDVDRMEISPECLSMMYREFLNENPSAYNSRSGENAHKRSTFKFDIRDCWEWWEGKSELSKKLLLKQLLEKDVGVDTMPPSFVAGQVKCRMRRERINAAKLRIEKIMHPLDANGTVDPEKKSKKRRGMVVDDVDWEDLIIETLIIHGVKEEEIEKGHYNTLLDLHVFNSGTV